MAWRVAKSLEVLRNQINGVSPQRNKESDGTIGDPSHQSRSSDHNPWVKDGKTGVVTALDITHDPARGVDAGNLAEQLRLSKDERIKYIISNGRIASSDKNWAWRKYNGKNPHTHHFHLSVKSQEEHYDDTSPWKIAMTLVPEQPTIINKERRKPLLVVGNKGGSVEELQKLLNDHGAKLTVDSDFGPKTEAAVKVFQRKHDLVPDGKVGIYTWGKLLP